MQPQLSEEEAAAARRNIARLPAMCYAFKACQPAGRRIVLVRAGQAGQFETECDVATLAVADARKIVDDMNRRLGVSENQKLAMLAGSTFGWHLPGADAETWSKLGGGGDEV